MPNDWSRWSLAGELPEMPRPSFDDYMLALFKPFVSAAERADLAGKLKTAHLPPDRSADQFALLRSTKSVDEEHVFLPPDSFIFRFDNLHGRYLCVQSDGLDAKGCENLVKWADSRGLEETELDEASFLFLVYTLRGAYKPKSKFLSPEAAEDLIDIVDADYVGHSIYQVKEWYRDVTIFKIPDDNSFQCRANFGVAASLAGSVSDFRSAIVPEPVANAIAELTEFPNINPENLYFALTATHWRHIVLEIYKCLEAAFFLPWAKKLCDVLGHQMSALDMAQHCKTNLRWREKEKDSIKALFELLPSPAVFDPRIQATVSFSDLVTGSCNAGAYGERVYKIRNQFVHQYDYDSPGPVKIDPETWPLLAIYLCNLLKILYSTFAKDIGYSFEILSSKTSPQEKPRRQP